MATFCQKAQKGLPLEINGKGKQSRDFIYVDDVVQAFVLAGFIKKKMEGKTYNISSGHMTSLTKIINAIKKNVKGVNVNFKPIAEDSISYCCDASKFKRDYGWKPMTSLSKGIVKSLKYFGWGNN